MGTYGTDVPITPGSGVSVKTYTDNASDHVQVVRTHKATTTGTRSTWALATTAATVLAADSARVGFWLVNTGGARVYIGFGSNPTAASHDTYLDPGDRYVSEPWEAELAVMMLAQAASGSLSYGTALAP